METAPLMGLEIPQVGNSQLGGHVRDEPVAMLSALAGALCAKGCRDRGDRCPMWMEVLSPPQRIFDTRSFGEQLPDPEVHEPLRVFAVCDLLLCIDDSHLCGRIAALCVRLLEARELLLHLLAGFPDRSAPLFELIDLRRPFSLRNR